MRKTMLLLVVGAILASCASGASAPNPTPGKLSGVVIGHLSEGGQQTPLANASVGVYRRALSSGGPIMQNPPRPVATTTTNSDGEFSFPGLPAGKWFVLAQNQAGQGTWVRFDPAAGAVVKLLVCTDCPIPL